MRHINSREEFYSLVNDKKLSVVVFGGTGCNTCAEYEKEVISVVDRYYPNVISKVAVHGLLSEIGVGYVPYTAFYRKGEVLFSFTGREEVEEIMVKIIQLS